MNRKALYNTFYKPFRKRFDPKTSFFGKAFFPKERFVLKEKWRERIGSFI